MSDMPNEEYDQPDPAPEPAEEPTHEDITPDE